MNKLGIEVKVKNQPKLDPKFIPMGKFFDAFLEDAKEPIAIGVERNGGQISVYDTFIHGTPEMLEADKYYIERLVKFLLWGKGGFRVTIFGNTEIYNYIKETYSATGARAFDNREMSNVYSADFEVVGKTYAEKVAEKGTSKSLGGHFDGCRIGFDAGGSDRKVSAVIDGECVYSEEVVWHPKLNSDPQYHFDGIVEAFRTAASKMPRVDAIGISSAGIFVENQAKLVSLFVKVPKDVFKEKVTDIYERAVKELGDIPFEVANDGDVTALAGAMDMKDTGVLGIAMGTSEAVGYVDMDGNITGWLNELAFTPVDADSDAMEDEWSGDIGCGVKYISQDGVIKLAPNAGIELDPALSPAEKLKVVQKLAEAGDQRALDVYESIGCYLAHTLPFYAKFYDYKNLLLLGRVTSGKGGEALLASCRKVLADEYPDFKGQLVLPDEKSRRVGQSYAAAGLVSLK